jgi:hypothetical protein
MLRTTVQVKIKKKKASRKKVNANTTHHNSLAVGMTFLNLVYTHLQIVKQYSYAI